MWFKIRIDSFKKIKRYVKRYNLECYLLFLFALLVCSMEIGQSYLFQVLIDNVLVFRNIKLVALVGMYIIAFSIISIIKIVKVKCTNYVDNRITYNVQLKVWNVLNHLYIGDYKLYDVGDLKLILDSDSTKFSSFIRIHIIDFFVNLIQVVVCIIILICYSWKLTLIGSVLIPFTFYVGKIISKKFEQIWEEFRNINQKFETFIWDSLQKWQDIKILCQENNKINEFSIYSESLCKVNEKKMFYYSISRVIALLKNEFFVKLLLYCCGGFLIIKGELTIGALFMFIKVFSSLLNYIESINNNNMEIYNDINRIDRVLAVINNKKQYKNCQMISEIKGNIRFKDVTFSYPGSLNPVFKNLNFDIQAGTISMISGASGVGKSTIIKLLIGEYKCNSGYITIDNYNINDVVNSNLDNYIGAVMQEAKFFNLSIRDNMRLIKSDVTDEELNEVFKKASLLDFIYSLEERYNTKIGERGIKLSGGQKQRLALARVLLKNPSIIILDEATSKLDGYTENNIYNVIKSFKDEKTVILITHRSKTVDFVDQVISI